MNLPTIDIRFKKCGHVRSIDEPSVKLAQNLNAALSCIECTDALMDEIDETGEITEEQQNRFNEIHTVDNWEIV